MYITEGRVIMRLRTMLQVFAAGAMLAAPVAALADNTLPTTPLWLQQQSNAVLQSQLNQQAAQQHMQQMLDQQRLTLTVQHQILQSQQDLNRLQLRFQLDQQSATLNQLLQTQEQQLLILQQSTKALPKSILDQIKASPSSSPSPAPKNH